MQLALLTIEQLNIGNFHALEVVDRSSETQLQVGENLNYFTLPSKG